MNKINVIRAKHDGLDREFFFSVTDEQMKRIKEGDVLLVDTMNGEQFATASSDPFTLEGDAIKLIADAGAYFPLKPVLEYVSEKMTAHIICHYLKCELAKITVNNFDYLPF